MRETDGLRKPYSSRLALNRASVFYRPRAAGNRVVPLQHPVPMTKEVSHVGA